MIDNYLQSGYRLGNKEDRRKRKNKVEKTFDIIGCLLICGGVFLSISIYKRMHEPLIRSIEKRCYRELETCYSGKVLEKSHGNHGEFYILSTKRSFTRRQWFTPKCQGQIERKITIGDSIYKPKGTWNFYIYKQSNPDSVIFIECNFDCNIYKEDE
jgi:hypothetical protein